MSDSETSNFSENESEQGEGISDSEGEDKRSIKSGNGSDGPRLRSVSRSRSHSRSVSRSRSRSQSRSRSRSISGSRSRSHSRSHSRSGSEIGVDEAEEAHSDDNEEPEEEPEGEDLDEYDEEEEEEDDDRSRKKKKKDKFREFIIEEAEVDDEPEDEEEWEEGAQEIGIVGNEVDEIGPTAREIEGRRRGTNLLDSQKQDEIEEYLRKKYANESGAAKHFGDGGEEMSDEITQQTLLPGVKDPNLWIVKCRIGEEKSTLLILMRKFLTYQSSETTDSVKQIFQLFVSTYPSTYFVRRKTYECTEYLLLVPEDRQVINALRRIPVTISTTEILIIVDSNVTNNSMLFDVELYGNSNANLVCRSAIWTLSENYLVPRKFKKINSYMDMERKSGIVNFQGRTVQASACYNPPLTYLSTTYENTSIDGTKALIFDANSDFEKDGIEMHFFMIIAEALNFTWTIRKPLGNDMFGRRENSTWKGGMLGQLVRNEVDVAFSGIWVSKDHNIVINLSEPWTQIFIQFLVPRPRTYNSFWGLIKPFSPTVWALLISIIIMTSLYTYTKAWINPKVPRRFRNFIVTTTELLGTLVGTWQPRQARGIRIQILLWQIFGLLIATAYSSSLASRLTNPEFEDKIDTVKQFIEANLTWGIQAPPPQYDEYFDLSDPYGRQMPDRFRPEADGNERHRRLLKRNYAIPGKFIWTVFYPYENVTNSDLKHLRMMKESLGNHYAAFALQPWLLEPFNTVFMRLKEAGIVEFHLRDVIRRRIGPNLRELLIDHDHLKVKHAIVLSIYPLGAGFAMLILCSLSAIVVFCAEVRVFSQIQNGAESL